MNSATFAEKHSPNPKNLIPISKISIVSSFNIIYRMHDIFFHDRGVPAVPTGEKPLGKTSS